MLPEKLLWTPHGHFDPFALCIYESEDDLWRKNISTLRLNYIENNPNFNYNDFISYLVSLHEHNHFLVHCSSEIGLLLTLISHMKYLAMVGYAKIVSGILDWDEKSQIQTIHQLNTIYDSIWSGDPIITQKEAVDSLNTFFFNHFKIKEPIFITSFPDKPHCPEPHFSYKNLLETSAVLAQSSQFDIFKPDMRFVNSFYNGLFKADYDTYAFLTLWAFGEIKKCIPAATIAINLAIDSRVPIIGSSLSKQVEWEDFHPGYRLVNFIGAAKAAVEYLKLDDPIYDDEPRVLYDYTVQKNILDIVKNIAKERGKQVLWDDPVVSKYETNIDVLKNNMSKEGLSKVGDSFFEGASSYVFKHLFECHNIIKKEKEKNSIGLYCAPIIDITKTSKLGNQNNPKETCYALFSIFNKNINSFYMRSKPESVLVGSLLYLKRISLVKLIEGHDMYSIKDYIDDNFIFVDNESDKEFKKLLYRSISVTFGFEMDIN